MSESEPGPRPRALGLRRRAAAAGMAAAALLLGASCMTTARVDRYAEQAPREPETGILIGAEPRTLGPEDARHALLFVHGFIGGSSNFHDLPDQAAARGWRVRVMLLPGHGAHPRDLERVRLPEYLEAIDAEIAALRESHDHVVLCGHSLGAALSVLASETVPPDGLILASPYFRVDYRWYLVLPPEAWIRAAGPLIRWVPVRAKQPPVRDKTVRQHIFSYAWIPARAGRVAMEAAREARDPARLARLELPVLMLHGRHDTVTSYRAAQRAFAKIGTEDKRFVTLPNSDHVLFWDFDQAQTAEETLRFLDRVAGMD